MYVEISLSLLLLIVDSNGIRPSAGAVFGIVMAVVLATHVTVLCLYSLYSLLTSYESYDN